ncbi:uncharacterized protein LOC132060972 [Lycium ferocissimum]|uniref:uncharacterized protein LOC132060972 n=1 Tax=Lycium ferocissimum TaxID=112874 RepID=UPI002814BD20|nr:uncharacterized protein LOC132060972 [Lycium ferocissimum]
MGDLPDDHCNLDTNMIARVLVGDIGKNPRFPIKDCITAVLKVYSKTVTRRKAYLGRRRAHEIVYGNWEGSFKKLPRYMAALQHFNHVLLLNGSSNRSLVCPVIFLSLCFGHSNHALMVLLIVGL